MKSQRPKVEGGGGARPVGRSTRRAPRSRAGPSLTVAPRGGGEGLRTELGGGGPLRGHTGDGMAAGATKRYPPPSPTAGGELASLPGDRGRGQFHGPPTQRRGLGEPPWGGGGGRGCPLRTGPGPGVGVEPEVGVPPLQHRRHLVGGPGTQHAPASLPLCMHRCGGPIGDSDGGSDRGCLLFNADTSTKCCAPGRRGRPFEGFLGVGMKRWPGLQLPASPLP